MWVKEDREKLDKLVGIALLDDDVHDRFIVERDCELFDQFRLSLPTQAWLQAVHAASLHEFAQAILSAPDGASY